MQYKFSAELRSKIIEYFKKNNNLEITNDTADEWLHSMAELFIIFNSIKD